MFAWEDNNERNLFSYQHNYLPYINNITLDDTKRRSIRFALYLFHRYVLFRFIFFSATIFGNLKW